MDRNKPNSQLSKLLLNQLPLSQLLPPVRLDRRHLKELQLHRPESPQ